MLKRLISKLKKQRADRRKEEACIRALNSAGAHGEGCRCNAPCFFTKNTILGNNCHFNGMAVKGEGHVTIGSNFHSGSGCQIITGFHDYDHGDALPYGMGVIHKDVSIGDNVWVGNNVIILGGTNIGEGAVIQAGSVVCVDVPKLAVAGGHPAVPFKYRDKEHYDKLLEEGKFH